MKIAVGNDHAGLRLKEELLEVLRELGCSVQDCGTYEAKSCDYADYAEQVCRLVVSDEVDRGLLICGTGIGMSIAANKINGVRAALVGDLFSARATRAHNNSNVLCLGSRVVGGGLASEILKIWLTEGFEGGRHQRRINKVMNLENGAE